MNGPELVALVAPAVFLWGVRAAARGSSRGPARRRLRGGRAAALGAGARGSGGAGAGARVAAVTCSVAAILGIARGWSPVLPLVAAAGLGVAVVLRRRGLRTGARRRAEADVVPVLDELVRGLRAGLAPGVALTDAQRTLGPALTSPRASPDLDVVLDEWEANAISPLIEEVVAQLRLGHRLGGLHPEFVAAVSQLLVERRQLAEEIDAQSSQARASAVVMTVAPVLFFAGLVLTDRRAARLMLHTPLGGALLAVGLCLDLVAFVWMRRLSNSVVGP